MRGEVHHAVFTQGQVLNDREPARIAETAEKHKLDSRAAVTGE